MSVNFKCNEKLIKLASDKKQVQRYKHYEKYLNAACPGSLNISLQEVMMVMSNCVHSITESCTILLIYQNAIFSHIQTDLN